MKTLFRVIKALRTEPEEYLDFLYGQNSEIKLSVSAKPQTLNKSFKTLFFFIKKVLALVHIRYSYPERTRVVAFAGTDNQLNSLKTTINELADKNISCCCIVHHTVRLNSAQLRNRTAVIFNLRVIFIGCMIFLVRAPLLLLKLKNGRMASSRIAQVVRYRYVYLYLAYFFDFLQAVSPELVMVSNDHSIPNRCLRIAAVQLGIKTLYMQHASVSELFPPLGFDYAFLDGKVAAQRYDACYRRFSDCKAIVEYAKKCHIVLSGQKKSVKTLENVYQKEVVVGVAVNNLDSEDDILELLNNLESQRILTIIRTHPYQHETVLRTIRDYTQSNDRCLWSDPSKENVACFFSKITCLIAGDSSIHLEAALAGRQTFYYKGVRTNRYDDYYGYVKNGLSLELSPGFNVKQIERSSSFATARDAVIRNYSETYLTEWQGEEGKLVAQSVALILDGEPLDSVFRKEKTEHYKCVYRLS